MRSTRDIDAFNQYSDWIFHHPHTREDELEWLEQQGPWSPGAASTTSSQAPPAYDALIFFTYLYAPTVLGLQVDPSRSILVPTAHDEPAIHLGIYKEMFRIPAAIAYNTEVERQFLKTRFEITRRRRRSWAAAWTCCQALMAEAPRRLPTIAANGAARRRLQPRSTSRSPRRRAATSRWRITS